MQNDESSTPPLAIMPLFAPSPASEDTHTHTTERVKGTPRSPLSLPPRGGSHTPRPPTSSRAYTAPPAHTPVGAGGVFGEKQVETGPGARPKRGRSLAGAPTCPARPATFAPSPPTPVPLQATQTPTVWLECRTQVKTQALRGELGSCEAFFNPPPSFQKCHPATSRPPPSSPPWRPPLPPTRTPTRPAGGPCAPRSG